MYCDVIYLVQSYKLQLQVGTTRTSCSSKTLSKEYNFKNSRSRLLVPLCSCIFLIFTPQKYLLIFGNSETNSELNKSRDEDSKPL